MNYVGVQPEAVGPCGPRASFRGDIFRTDYLHVSSDHRTLGNSKVF